MVGRLGLGASYGAPAKAFEAAFDAGCNYFYWGALRNNKMAEAIRNIVKKGKRDDLVLVIQDFRRSPTGFEKSLTRGLKKVGLDTADVLLIGWRNKPPKLKILEAAEKLREQGVFRYLGLSSHKRSLFPELAKDSRYDLFHIRYNAANRGAEEDLFPHLPEERPGNVCLSQNRKRSLPMKSIQQPETVIVLLYPILLWMWSSPDHPMPSSSKRTWLRSPKVR
jgi:aryl-alcohol dehydrogenase-like predicted oxidoreductase